MISNGYFSFEREAHLSNIPVFPESTAYSYLVAPYWLNFNTHHGTVSYEVHSGVSGLISVVNNFIQQQDDKDFVGTWMLVATFEDVPQQDDTIERVS